MLVIKTKMLKEKKQSNLLTFILYMVFIRICIALFVRREYVCVYNLAK